MRTRRGWGLVGGRPWGIWRDSSIPVYRVCCPRQGSRASSAAPSQSSGPGHAAGARQRALGGAGLRPVRTSFFFCSRFPRGPQSQLACDLAAERGFPSTNWDGRLGLSRWGWFRQGAGSRLGGGGRSRPEASPERQELGEGARGRGGRQGEGRGRGSWLADKVCDLSGLPNLDSPTWQAPCQELPKRKHLAWAPSQHPALLLKSTAQARLCAPRPAPGLC